MKIAMISEGRVPLCGGGQMHVQHLCRGLTEEYGYSIDLFVRRLKGDDGTLYTQDEVFSHGKWHVIRTGWTARFFSVFHRILWLIQMTWILYRKTKQERYDLLHGHALLPGIPIKIVSILTGVPSVFTVHGTMHLDRGKKNLHYYLEKFIVCVLRYDTEISVSKKIFDYPNKNTDIHIIYNGVDSKKYQSIQVKKKYLGFQALTVARIDRQKNHLIMLEIIRQSDKKLLEKSGFVRNIVGDGPLRETLERYVKAHRLGKYVCFKGKLLGNELIHEYKSNHLFILPSLAEGQPLTILEAMASSLPILATDVGENAEFVHEGVEGYLVPAGDRQMLQERLVRMLQHDSVLEHIGAHNQTLAIEYDRTEVIKKTVQVYTDLLSVRK